MRWFSIPSASKLPLLYNRQNFLTVRVRGSLHSTWLVIDKIMASMCSTEIPLANVSSRPWFLTCDPETNAVLVWKNEMRMKLKDGSSSGEVKTASVLSQLEKTIMVSGI